MEWKGKKKNAKNSRLFSVFFEFDILCQASEWLNVPIIIIIYVVLHLPLTMHRAHAMRFVS